MFVLIFSPVTGRQHASQFGFKFTPAPGARTDWRLDPTRAAADAQVVRTSMPAKWNWPLAAPVKLKTKASDGSPLELVPYGCARLRISMFPDARDRSGKSAASPCHTSGGRIVTWCLGPRRQDLFQPWLSGHSAWHRAAEATP